LKFNFNLCIVLTLADGGKTLQIVICKRIKASVIIEMAVAEASLLISGALSQTQKVAGVSTLDQLPFGVEARVVAIGGANAVARRLMEMGVVPGAPVRVIKAAPLGDPIEIRVRGYNLALRRNEAQTISITAQRT